MSKLLSLGVELADGWTVKEIAGLVFIGILTTVIWFKFRQMQFPAEWEHGPGHARDPNERDSKKPQEPEAPPRNQAGR
ncbi:MAG: hypothetical protein IAE78_33620 [Myxococcus sp.]|nr:hypothetical protein [Myxococcus sp.]